MKNTEKLPTVSDLNDIQAAWMSLDLKAPENEKQRVFALMKKLPRSFLSAKEDLSVAMPIIESMPIWAEMRPIDKAKKALINHPKARVDCAWVGEKGVWMPL
jgi:hypothetical protein